MPEIKVGESDGEQEVRITICQDCKHSIFNHRVSTVALCGVSRKDFVSHGATSRKPCVEVNTDGNCALFEKLS